METRTFSSPSPVSAPVSLPNGAQRVFPWGRLVFALLGVLCLPLLLSFSEGERGLLALCIAGTLFFLLKRSPNVGAVASLAYLALMGGLRRWLIPVFGWSGTDSMLLAVPLAALMFLATTRRTYRTTPLMRLLVGLIAFMAVEVVNPLQGGLAVGTAGMLFYIAPLLWYFIGRQIGSPQMMRYVYRTTAVVAVLAALYGLYQTYFGFNPAELMWMDTVKSSYASLDAGGGTIRAFSIFTSAQEYATFLSVGIVMLWVLFLRGNRFVLLLIPLLGVGLFLESERGPIITVLLSSAILWAVQGRTKQQWLPRLVGGGLIAAIVLVGGLRHLQDTTFSDSTQALVAHQTNGLLNPTDSSKSTAGAHSTMIAGGILHGFLNPIGMGLGSTTIAARKFGGIAGNSEMDLSNMFLSLGFIGGLLYIAVMIVVLTAAVRYWLQVRSTTALGLLGIILALMGAWLNGGAYSTSMLAWLCIGVLDRLQQTARLPSSQRKSTSPLHIRPTFPAAEMH